MVLYVMMFARSLMLDVEVATSLKAAAAAAAAINADDVSYL